MRLTCKCGKMLRVNDALAGKKVKCPQCGRVATIPTVAKDASPSRPTPAPSSKVKPPSPTKMRPAPPTKMGAAPPPPALPHEEEDNLLLEMPPPSLSALSSTRRARKKPPSPRVIGLVIGGALLAIAVVVGVAFFALSPGAPTQLASVERPTKPTGTQEASAPPSTRSRKGTEKSSKSSRPPAPSEPSPSKPDANEPRGKEPGPKASSPDQASESVLDLRKVGIDKLAYSSDGSLLATVTTSLQGGSMLVGRVVFWDRATEKVKAMPEDTGVTAYKYLRFSPNGQMVAAINTDKQKIWLWDVKSAKLLRTYSTTAKEGAEVPFFEFTPDNQFLVFLARETEKNKVCKVHTASERVEEVAGLDLKNIDNFSGPVVYSPANDLLVSAYTDQQQNPAKNFLQVSHILHPGPPRNVSVPGRAGAKAFSADGKTLAFAYTSEEEGKQGLVEVWDTATWKQRLVLQSKGSPAPPYVSAVLLSRDGKYLVEKLVQKGSSDEVFQAWDVAGKKQLPLEGKAPVDAQLAPDGKTLVLPGSLEPARFLDVTTGKDKGP